MNFKWLETTGGPFIILNSKDVKKWSGSFSIQSIEKQEIIIENDFLNPNKTHYGQACQIVDEIGIINFELNPAIVLSHELPTTFKKLNKDTLLIFRWEYGKSIEYIEDSLESLILDDVENWLKINLSIKLNGEYTLFDSSSIGFDLQEKNLVKFEIDSGAYSIVIGDYKPDEHTFLIVFKFGRQ